METATRRTFANKSALGHAWHCIWGGCFAFCAASVKAFILCAGLGTRLRSLGLDCPKVMVPVGGKPLLQHHVELLREQGITDLIVNLHYLPETIVRRFGDGR